jgi:large subunit ribosomal protein L29
MKISELRELTDAELLQKEKEFKRELFNFRFQVATGQQTNTAGLNQTKRKIARLKTVLRERQLGKSPRVTPAAQTAAK